MIFQKAIKFLRKLYLLKHSQLELKGRKLITELKRLLHHQFSTGRELSQHLVSYKLLHEREEMTRRAVRRAQGTEPSKSHGELSRGLET